MSRAELMAVLWQRRNVMLLVLVLMQTYSVEATTTGQNNVVDNDQIWKDSDGTRIEAHGGSLTHDGQNWYWFGETTKDSWSGQGVNRYIDSRTGSQFPAVPGPRTSWKAAGIALSQSQIKDFMCHHTFDNGLDTFMARQGWDRCDAPPYAVERPKVLRSPSTGKYVMWFHLDGWDYKLRAAAVAQSDSLNGTWTMINAFHTGGKPSLDINVWKDRQTDQAYVVRSVDNGYAGIALLTDDYLGTVKEVGRTDDAYEGCAIFRLDAAAVYMLCSTLTGWEPNAAHLFRAYYKGQTESYNVPTLDHPDLAWKFEGNPTHSTNSWWTQPSGMVEIPHNLPKDSFPKYFLYMGDNWKNGIKQDGSACADAEDCGASASYKWFPWYTKLTWPIALRGPEKWSVEFDGSFPTLSADFCQHVQWAAVNYGWRAIDTYKDSSRVPADKLNGDTEMAKARLAANEILSVDILNEVQELAELRAWYTAQLYLKYHERYATWDKLAAQVDNLSALMEKEKGSMWGPDKVRLVVSGFNEMFEYASWYTAFAKYGDDSEAQRNLLLSEGIQQAMSTSDSLLLV